MISSFLVKVLLSILTEAAGVGTTTHRELLTILPSLENEADIRELYGKSFGSLLVGSCSYRFRKFIIIYRKLQKKSDDYELDLVAKIYVHDFVKPRQKFASIIKSFYYTGNFKKRFE